VWWGGGVSSRGKSTWVCVGEIILYGEVLMVLSPRPEGVHG